MIRVTFRGRAIAAPTSFENCERSYICAVKKRDKMMFVHVRVAKKSKPRLDVLVVEEKQQLQDLQGQHRRR